MKNFFQKCTVVLSLVGLVVAFGGCSLLSANKVGTYNDTIVTIYNKYVTETGTVFDTITPETDAAKIISSLQKAKAETEVYQKSFKDIPAPEEAKKLAEAMDAVFEAEKRGLDTLISTYQKSTGKLSDSTMMSITTQLEKDETVTSDNFEKVQNELAAKYGFQVK